MQAAALVGNICLHKSTRAAGGIGNTAHCSAVPRLPVLTLALGLVSQPAHLCSAGTCCVGCCSDTPLSVPNAAETYDSASGSMERHVAGESVGSR